MRLCPSDFCVMTHQACVFGFHDGSLKEVQPLVPKKLKGADQAVVLGDMLIVEHHCALILHPDVEKSVTSYVLEIHHCCSHEPCELLHR